MPTTPYGMPLAVPQGNSDRTYFVFGASAASDQRVASVVAEQDDAAVAPRMCLTSELGNLTLAKRAN
jgi:hypothetical protein